MQDKSAKRAECVDMIIRTYESLELKTSIPTCSFFFNRYIATTLLKYVRLNRKLYNLLCLSHEAAKRIYKSNNNTNEDMHRVLTYPITSRESFMSDNTTKE